LASSYSCSESGAEFEELATIQRTVIVRECHTDSTGTALEKLLSYIDGYYSANNLYATSSTITFVSSIDDSPAEIAQSTEHNSNDITQKLTTNCRVETSYSKDYIDAPDYLTCHCKRKLIVSQQEGISTVVRKSSAGTWSEWTYYTDYYKASPNHAKNIAIFGGSFAHNIRDDKKGTEGFGFDHNGKTTSLQDLIADIFACKHIGNYAQSGQGVYTGTPIQGTREPYFKYNMYEQIKYAFEISREKGFSYDVFLLFGGINDCAIDAPIGLAIAPAGDYSYIASFKKSIEYIKSNNPEAKIYLITSFPVFDGTSQYGSLYKYVNANIRLSKFYDLPLLDIYNRKFFTDENFAPYYLRDKVHPNGEGYRIVSSFIINLIN
jgi:lysophospholipase L1-like esterase